MNDPYIVALVYTVEHGGLGSYKNACPFELRRFARISFDGGKRNRTI